MTLLSSCTTSSPNGIQISERTQPEVGTKVETNEPKVDPVQLQFLVEGWETDGETAVVNNESELARLINGGAVYFIERGVKKAAFQDYKSSRKDVYLNLELYEAGNAKQAEKIQNGYFVEQPVILSDIGRNVRLANKLLGVYFIDFYLGKYYSRLTITEKTDQSKKEIIRFAEALYKLIGN